MTAQKLYGTLKFIDELDTKLRLQTFLEAIRDSLSNLASAPTQPQHQNALADAISQFTTAAAKLGASITPSQAGVIAELGGAEFFDPSIAEKVKASISANPMTPSVVRDFVQDIATRRAAFLANVKSTLQGLQKLNVSEPVLQPGSSDLAFLIPRDLFQNQLGEFAKELTFISRLIQDVSEGVTGNIAPVALEELSSSVPTIALAAGLTVIATLATIVNKFLETWERIEKIRRVRTELIEVGLKGTAVEELDEQITTEVNTVVETSTQLILVNYTGDGGRKHELATALTQNTRRLFGQIERGLTIEFRAEPKPNAAEEDRNALDTIADLGQTMQFPSISNEPVLLESGEILEGDIRAVKHVKKTTTQKTTVTKKETHKDGKQE
jgi:hypothetical protein